MPKPPVTVYRLVFDDPAYAEYVVRVRGAIIQELYDAEGLRDLRDDKTRTPKERTEAVWGAFLKRVIEWNITDDDDVPMPITFESLCSMEPGFVTAMVTASVVAGTEAPAPLGRPSSDGNLSLVASIPMETPSASLVS